MIDREKVIDYLKWAIAEAELTGHTSITLEPLKDALTLLKDQETIPSYNDAVDTIKFQSKVMGFACQKLAEYESEEPCNTLFYIKEQRQKCDERCCNDKTPDEWCWKRYITLMVTEDSPTSEQMRDTKREEK